MQSVPPTPPGKEPVTQNMVTSHIHRRNGERLDRRVVDYTYQIDWVMTIGQARLGFIDIKLADRAAYWPRGANANNYQGPRGKTASR